MKNFRSILLIGIVFFSTNVMGAEVPGGLWGQTSSTAGDCSNCEINISQLTPHIIQIIANNDWIGFAHYDKEADKYNGFSEWKKGTGGSYKNKVQFINLIYENKTLTISNRVTSNFSSTYRQK